jgi:DNA-directed RNA polymerase specialized sigma24 family protein
VTETLVPAALGALYWQHYRALVRLAALLVWDTPTAEDVVQDAFVALHGGRQRLTDADNALACLRQVVVNRPRSVLRHLCVPRISSTALTSRVALHAVRP